MKIVLVVLLFISGNIMSQKDTASLKISILSLNNALIEKDTLMLNNLIDDNITYGHSNGWIQTKKEMITEFYSGKIEYKYINPVSQSTNLSGEIAIVRSITKVEGIVNTVAFNMSLQILQLWKFVDKKWVLIARQSVKV